VTTPAEHIGALGSVDADVSVRSRLAFWAKLPQRLAALGNRLGDDEQSKVYAALHSRIPMVTIDEQQALKLENAEADERFWSSLQNVHEGVAQGHKGLVATVERAIAAAEVGRTEAAAKTAEAKARAERIKQGEDTPGRLGKPVTREDFERAIREAGGDPKHAVRLSEICDALGFETVLKGVLAAKDRAERAAIRRMHRLITQA
jgi:hypothetical protein